MPTSDGIIVGFVVANWIYSAIDSPTTGTGQDSLRMFVSRLSSGSKLKGYIEYRIDRVLELIEPLSCNTDASFADIMQELVDDRGMVRYVGSTSAPQEVSVAEEVDRWFGELKNFLYSMLLT